MNKILIKQVIRFGFVGGTAFIVDYGILFLLTSVVKINYLAASCISFSVSVIVNYILSNLFVFKMKKEKHTLLVFLIISIFGLGINQIIMWGMTEKLNVYYMMSKIGATFIVMCWNFIMRKIFLEDRV